MKKSFLNKRIFSEADLIVIDGKIYHLSITPEQLAQNIILVGDPDRVPLLAKKFLKKEWRTDVYRRGLRTITGETKNGLPVSIICTGMGAPSTEIVINEIIILNEIDLQTRMRREKPLYENLNIIRLGTCGGLQKDTPLGTFIITEYGIDFSNTGLFYSFDNKVPEKVLQLEAKAKQMVLDQEDPSSRFYNKINPYATMASPEVVEALSQSALEKNISAKKGITISTSSFFANQGRKVLEANLTIPDINKLFSGLDFDGLKAENMDMESVFLCYFVSSLGYRIGSICLTLANREENTFYYGSYEKKILEGMQMIIDSFEKLQEKELSINKRPEEKSTGLSSTSF